MLFVLQVAYMYVWEVGKVRVGPRQALQDLDLDLQEDLEGNLAPLTKQLLIFFLLARASLCLQIY